jgi:stage V sporulation protein G
VEITEVRVKLVNVKNDKLRAFCSITVDNDFVVRDLKVIEGAKGAFVAMPSRKLTERCPRCSGKNHYRARYCNDCGARLSGDRSGPHESAQKKMHTDIAHPINSRCREVIQKRVLEVYQEEVQKSGEPDYKPMELEVFDEDSLTDETMTDMVPRAAAAADLAEPKGGERKSVSNGDPPLQVDYAGSKPLSPAAAPRGEDGPERPFSEGDRRDRGRGGFRQSFGGPRQQNEPGRPEGRRPNGGGGAGEGRRGPGHEGRREPAPQGRREPALERTGPERERTPDLASPHGNDRTGHERPVHERAREPFPQVRPAAPAASSSGVAAPPPARERMREETDPEPEDNFGVGLFN